ncbi:MAG: hypothetical protein EBT07_09215 [Actinobacteria bacterium]|jgi:hypothetical protein|nr:hypothetical protein [Actinomycetota bacterium]
MAANKILNEFKAFTNFAHLGFKYNLQTFPDTITAASFLFALLFQSPPLAALTGSIVLLNFIHPVFANFMSDVVGGGDPVGPACSGRFGPGISFERLADMSSSKTFGKPDLNSWPSYYSLFLGFITAYIGTMPILYQKELDASPSRRASTTSGLVILGIVIVTAFLYRWLSECDTPFGLLVGAGAGAFVGLMVVLFFAWISDRRLTNLLAFPLIRQRAPDGKPIYVCERK